MDKCPSFRKLVKESKNIEQNYCENGISYELRVVGETLPGTNYYVSTDGGVTWQRINALKTKYDFAPPGKNLKIKVELNSAATQIYSLVLLHS